MELRHLRYFVAVAEEGAFNRAAQRLLVAQPSLSRQINDLERELGHRLFERTARGVKLTAGGDALLRHARQILGMTSATQEVVAGAAVVRQAVSIGIPPGTPDRWLIELAREVAGTAGHVALSYVEAGSTEQLRMLREGRLDLCLVHQAPPADHKSWLLRQEQLGIAVRPSHPLAAKDEFHIADLDAVRVLLHSREQVPTQQEGLVQAVHAADVRPHWQFAQFIEHAYACAEATHSDVALLSRYTAATQLPHWRWGPLAGLDPGMTTWLVCQRQTRAIVFEVAGITRGVLTRAEGAEGAAS